MSTIIYTIVFVIILIEFVLPLTREYSGNSIGVLMAVEDGVDLIFDVSSLACRYCYVFRCYFQFLGYADQVASRFFFWMLSSGSYLGNVMFGGSVWPFCVIQHIG